METPDFVFSARTGSPSRRSGSALVIVLGMLSVMMLMAVAFSTFMRMERGATTNLKNSHVAEQSLHTAVALAIQSIEDSFSEIEDGNGYAVVDSPAAIWPNPWISSCDPASLTLDTDPYFQSRRRKGKGTVANVLTAEMAEHLSSNQIAMIRSANVGWAPIYSGIGASSVFKENEDQTGSNAGYPQNDSIVGRYAFVALDTTGYLDIGKIGGMDANDRKHSSGGDPMFFIPPDGQAKDPDGHKIASPFKSGGPKKLETAVSSCGAFLSYADVKRKDGAGLVMKRPAEVSAGDYMPPDLYSGSTVSLESFTPDGEPKVAIPTKREFGELQAKDMVAFAKRAFPAMASVLARSRKNGWTGTSDHWTDPEKIILFEGTGKKDKMATISKAALATVGLLDAADNDQIPGKSQKLGVKYWEQLRDMGEISVLVDGSEVSDSAGLPSEKDSVFEDPLNFPCTESAPLLTMVYAYVTIDDLEPEPQYDKKRVQGKEGISGPSVVQDSGWYKEYPGSIHVGVRATCQNHSAVKAKDRKPYSMKVEFDVLGETPPDGTVSKGSVGSGDIAERLSFDENARIEWSDFFVENESFTVDGVDIYDTETSTDGRLLATGTGADEITVPFTVRCGLRNVTAAGIYDLATGEPSEYPGGIEDPENWYPLTTYEYLAKYEGGDDADFWVPVRFKVSIFQDGNKPVQQVPAPAIGEKSWWLRVDMGLYHGRDSRWVDVTGSSANGSLGELAPGWAVCLAPQFGMDTTCLATDAGTAPIWSSRLKPWLNNICALADYDGNAEAEAALHDAAKKLATHDDVIADFQGDSGGAATGGVFSDLQQEWLFEDEALWSEWLSTATDRPFPDLMHRIGKHSDWFVGDSEFRLGFELYTRLPVDGIDCVADLGSLTIAPYETLSLFKTWRPRSPEGSEKEKWPESDFHPVFDYFTMSADRYPTRDQIRAQTDSDGTIKWEKLNRANLFSAVDSGLVNLNLPRLLEVVEDKEASNLHRVEPSRNFNPYPLAAAINGAPYPVLTNSGRPSTNVVSASAALSIASAYASMLAYVDDHPSDEDLQSVTLFNQVTNFVRLAGADVSRPVVRDASFFASACGSDSNAVLGAFVESIPSNDSKFLCDFSREGVLRGVADAFTTRGQSFLVAIRADAYTSRFGMEDDPSEGATLASTHALVELFRDPEPARLPDGSLPLDKNGDPVLYHNWMIRSFRMF